MNNEFAFPRIVPEGDTLQPGMTLRQWYAGLAMPTLILQLTEIPYDDIVKYSFEIADKMIIESNKTIQNEK